jgi:hypothetical protein
VVDTVHHVAGGARLQGGLVAGDHALGEALLGLPDRLAELVLELDGQVGAEDRVLVEAVQRGIGSGGLDSGVLLPESEQLIARFQALVLDALGS